ncbi:MULTISPECIES: DUF2938 domain-containing protein [Pseudoalteromonas]|uniref:DUF2938 domain-containing protein n=1 Tax=Pseudoalteromonas luteoviolacea (strain 2ta16) TaxID=1353533 RepID=V4HQP8_PSEL2|nr:MULTISPECIES: DUF2938 domain-containing protein [Pseudoalteromonas]ESP90249.1 protein of unknown function (DUF2938) [Pseudoalteromonas luteoviolacea 2ta16]KZN29885.1 hypothetical protein N483_06350 [Pseudoalteromonas luteoviolacea NCIMB 1944]MCG7550591.1 DUF2938 domain-containing protein [Pseudoalteromonas sp. Of7M-16]
MESLVQVILVGIGATLIMDLWALLLKVSFGIPSLNYGMVGRWCVYLTKGKVFHQGIMKTPPVSGENLLGWIAHYVIGVAFAALLFLVLGSEWIESPTLLPALVAGVVTMVFPFFIMQPCFGMGVAASKLPNPNTLRFRSLLAHLSFGIGLYLSAKLIMTLA